MPVEGFFHQSTFCGTINRFLALATENYPISGFLRGLIERNGTLALAIQCFFRPFIGFCTRRHCGRSIPGSTYV